MKNFAGRWLTTFGPMDLQREGHAVSGTYGKASGGSLTGTIEDGVLRFHYEEAGEQGSGEFDIVRQGKFKGRYLPDGAANWKTWEGQRGFDGLWDASFGRLRLLQEDERVIGFYEGPGSSTIEGHIEGNRLVFHYREPSTHGTGTFDLAEDGLSFAGQWQAEGSTMWGDWRGRRVLPEPGLTWLMVLEAHWQTSLADNEYAFGHMLREVFARLSHVRVRQRFFQDEVSLTRWCRELLYLPEPAILMISSHGTPEGLSVHGKTINTDKVLESVRHADNLKLLHFSSCLILHDGEEALRARVERVPFPVSGYTTSVDWGGSALVEFTYLDMILAKGLSPARAAELLPQLIAFAGDDSVAGAPYYPLGFRFFE